MTVKLRNTNNKIRSRILYCTFHNSIETVFVNIPFKMWFFDKSHASNNMKDFHSFISSTFQLSNPSAFTPASHCIVNDFSNIYFKFRFIEKWICTPWKMKIKWKIMEKICMFSIYLQRKRKNKEKNEKEIIQIKGSIENLFLVRKDLGKI